MNFILRRYSLLPENNPTSCDAEETCHYPLAEMRKPGYPHLTMPLYRVQSVCVCLSTEQWHAQRERSEKKRRWRKDHGVWDRSSKSCPGVVLAKATFMLSRKMKECEKFSDQVYGVAISVVDPFPAERPAAVKGKTQRF